MIWMAQISDAESLRQLWGCEGSVHLPVVFFGNRQGLRVRPSSYPVLKEATPA